MIKYHQHLEHSLRIKSFFFFILALFSLLNTALADVNIEAESFEEEKKQVQKGIKNYKINIRRLEQGISSQKKDVESNLQQERDLLAEIKNIDLRLHEQQDKLIVLDKKMANQNVLIASKEEEIKQAKEKHHAVKIHLESRIHAYYKMGRIGVINVAFSSQNLPDLLAFHDAFQYLLKYDKKLIDSYRDSINKLESTKKALVLEQNLLSDYMHQVKIEQESINFIKQEKQTLLAQIKSQVSLHNQAIFEMEKAVRDLTSSLIVLENKEKILEQGFLLKKGKHPAPVDGVVITRFRQVTQNKLGIRKKSTGISIKAPNGSKIKAIYDGTVIFAGYFRGYGNTVIINHGHNYFTITSRIERLSVTKGQQIKTGDIIGLSGNTATLIEDGIHFEIKKEKQSMNPLHWIDHKNLIIKKQ